MDWRPSAPPSLSLILSLLITPSSGVDRRASAALAPTQRPWGLGTAGHHSAHPAHGCAARLVAVPAHLAARGVRQQTGPLPGHAVRRPRARGRVAALARAGPHGGGIRRAAVVEELLPRPVPAAPERRRDHRPQRARAPPKGAGVDVGFQ
eukprot:5698337-Prymnesium_polylepis.2